MTGQGTETKRLPKSIREALPEEQQAKSRIYAKDLAGELQDEVWRMFRDGLAPLAERGPARIDPAPVPEVGLPVEREPCPHRGGGRAARRLEGRRRVPQRLVAQREERRADGPLPRRAEHPVRDGRRAAGLQELGAGPDARDIVGPGPGRFHGRNAETWEKKGITPAERFRYLYSRDELSEWVPRIREAASEAREVHLMFNNCYANYGTTNAREIALLLAELDAGED